MESDVRTRRRTRRLPYPVFSLWMLICTTLAVVRSAARFTFLKPEHAYKGEGFQLMGELLLILGLWLLGLLVMFDAHLVSLADPTDGP